jgi:hypothetical protein
MSSRTQDVTAQPGSQLGATVANLPKTSRAVPVAIPAGVTVNGQVTPGEVPIAAAGSRFYVIVTSATIYLQPLRAGNVGATNPFNNGQGQPVAGGFETLTAKNFNLFPVVALIWVGFDDFINDQLILANNATPNVTYPTQPISATPVTGTVAIPDLSGTTFLDINGKKWYALYRVSLIVSNFSSATTLLLQKAGAATSNGPSVLLCPPQLPIAHNSSGDFSLSVGGGAVPAIVSEIYAAFAGS